MLWLRLSSSRVSRWQGKQRDWLVIVIQLSMLSMLMCSSWCSSCSSCSLCVCPLVLYLYSFSFCLSVFVFVCQSHAHKTYRGDISTITPTYSTYTTYATYKHRIYKQILHSNTNYVLHFVATCHTRCQLVVSISSLSLSLFLSSATMLFVLVFSVVKKAKKRKEEKEEE